MGRKQIDSAVLAKIETTYGVDPTPTGVANAVRVFGQTIGTLNIKYIQNEYLKGYAGGHADLIGAIHKKIGYSVDLAGSGAAGTAPAYGPLIRACAFAEAISVGARVEYTPVSSAEESLGQYYYDSGALYKQLGARGDFELNMISGEKPSLKFDLLGIDGGAVTAASTPATTLTAFKDPLVVTNPNTADVLIGCTYATGALSGGTAYPSNGLNFKTANSPSHDEMLGGEAITIDRKGITGSITLDLTAAQEVTFEGYVRAGTLLSVGLVHGTSAGYKVIVFAPSCQFKNPKPVYVNGQRRTSFDLSALPTSAGNDDLRIVVL
jgi:hypothetical protein